MIVKFEFSTAENKLQSFVCEGSQFSLSCPNGDVMQVVSALYGRNDAERCSLNSQILVKILIFISRLLSVCRALLLTALGLGGGHTVTSVCSLTVQHPSSTVCLPLAPRQLGSRKVMIQLVLQSPRKTFIFLGAPSHQLEILDSP